MTRVAEGERRLVFDTRGRRKHVVRVVYAILALLMGASLFLVVGPVNIGNLLGTASSTSPSTIFEEQAERIERKLRTEPTNENLLLALTRAHSSAGNALTEVNSETGLTSFTPEGKQQLALAAESWNRYLKQADEPNPAGALLMARTFFRLAESSVSLEEAEDNVQKAADAQRIAAESRPSLGTLSSLAIYEYYANDFAAGDKAAKQAVAKAPNEEAKEGKKQMAEYRKRGKAFETRKAEFAKLEKSQSKEALQNPLGGSLGGASGSLGQ
jgi:hypothetical protein